MTPLTTPARWVDAAWQGAALGWARAASQGVGATVTGWTQPHVRPWSTVLRLENARDPLWLKANGDGTRHEARVLALFAELELPHTQRPLAVDVERGWTLLPDGGPTAREAHGGLLPLDDTVGLLTNYAELQRATEPHVDAFLAAGVDDLRPRRMPVVLTSVLDELAQAPPPRGLDGASVARLRSLMPAYVDACAELDAGPVQPALQHDDLHSNNVFQRECVVFDWGDCVVGHPFGTLLSSLNSVAHHHRLDRDDPALRRLADAYTEAWSDVADRATLRRQVELAVRVGPLTRVLAWRRALEGVDEDALDEWGDNVGGWLTEIESDDLPLHPAALV